MTGGTFWLTIGALVTAVCALAGVIYTARTSHRATQEQAQTAPYADLAARMAILEAKVQRLERREQVLLHHLRDLWSWIARGAKPPAPTIPAELHDVIDPAWYHPPAGS